MEDELSKEIIGAAIEVHNVLGGPGLLESIYEAALFHELQIRGFNVKKQIAIPVIYKDRKIKDTLVLDLLVNDKVIIEVKASDKNIQLYEQQLLTYLRLTTLKLGLIINFGGGTLKEGIRRIVNNL